MKQEKFIHFQPVNLTDVTVTHGYHINHAFPVHFHSSYNLGLIEAGEREFSYRGESILLKAGDVFVVQPFEPHSCCSRKNEVHSYKMVSFKLNFSCYFPQFVLYDPALKVLLDDFHAQAEYEAASSELPALFSQLIRMVQGHAVADVEKAALVTEREAVAQVRKFIEANCLAEMSLAEMAACANLSEFHFNRLFHQYLGLSPYAYYLFCKVKKAQGILLASGSVLDTVFESGFFDQSHFTRLFKKHIGVTPGKYLRENQ